MSNRIALGNTEVSPLNQAAEYSTFANSGLRRDPHVVAEVLGADGKSQYQADVTGSQDDRHRRTQTTSRTRSPR